jgi:hypothetical protein
MLYAKTRSGVKRSKLEMPRLSSEIDKTTKSCIRCGGDLDEGQVLKFDTRCCIYCQDQKTGRFETSAYAYVRELLIRDYFMAVEKMDRKTAEIAVDETIARNPLIIRKWHCKPCTMGACAVEYTQFKK